MACLGRSAEKVDRGKTVRVKGMPKDCGRKLFRVPVSPHRTDYPVTNGVAPREAAAAKQESSVRWTIEPFHRERGHLTGVQACQRRRARSQRNHLTLAGRARTRLKQAAHHT